MDTTITWLIRYGHVLSAATWMGSFALLALLVVPLFRRDQSSSITRLAESVVRVLSASGVSAMVFGVLLIWRTRGFGQVGRGEWGILVVASIVIAIVLVTISDGALRPALRRIAETGDASRAQRLSVAGLLLAVVAIGIMTRALYASS